jgi:Flp pilus assembly protein TadD
MVRTFSIAILLISLSLSTVHALSISNHDALKKALAAEERYNYAEALQWYQTAWQQDQSDINVLISISKQFTGLERLDEARDTFLEVIKLDPKNAEAHTLLAIYYENFADEFELAKTHYQNAIDAEPNYIRPCIKLCALHLQLQELDEAEGLGKTLIQTFPKRHEGYTFLGNLQTKQGDIDEAVRNLKKAVALTNDDPEPYRLLGQALARNGKRDEAQTALDQYKKIKEANETLSSLITLVRRTPDNANHWFQLGKHYLKRKQTGDALNALTKSAELAPESPAVHHLTGAVYLQNKQPKQAQPHLEAAVSLEPGNADNHNNLGVCYLMQNNYAAAVTAFQTAVSLGKDEPGIRRNLSIAKQKLQESK